MQARILIVDDDEVSCQLFAEVLEGDGHRTHQAHSGEESLDRLRKESYDLLLVDVRMPGITGLEVTRTMRQEQPSLPVIVMTAFGSIETAVEAIQEGAYDYVSKPMNLEELKKIVSRALGQKKLRAQAGTKVEQIDGAEPQKTVIGRSPAMVEVFKMVARAAPTKSTVLILGESGTGKEVIARSIHQHSTRAQRPFVAVDCGALTETLLKVNCSDTCGVLLLALSPIRRVYFRRLTVARAFSTRSETLALTCKRSSCEFCKRRKSDP